MKWLMAIPVWSTPRDSLNRFNLVFSRCPYEESPLRLSFLRGDFGAVDAEVVGATLVVAPTTVLTRGRPQGSPLLPFDDKHKRQKPPLCKGRWHGVSCDRGVDRQSPSLAYARQPPLHKGAFDLLCPTAFPPHKKDRLAAVFYLSSVKPKI